jgi:hypothetical protein
MTSRRATKTPLAGEMYLQGLYAVEERIPAEARFPFTLPFIRGLDLGLDQPVTFFVGENGSGKSSGVSPSCRSPYRQPHLSDSGRIFYSGTVLSPEAYW